MSDFHVNRTRLKEGLILKKTVLKIAGIASVLIMLGCMITFARSEDPVRIVFDKNSERIDIVTGRKLPDYKLAQRGSIRFFLGRLDTPEKGFWYFFDGRRYMSIENLVFIRKIASIGCWVILADSRGGAAPSGHPKENCEIIHHAVSFIPLNDKGQPEQRVYVLLEDLDKIQWREYDHWLATDTQEQLEAKKGIVY